MANESPALSEQLNREQLVRSQLQGNLNEIVHPLLPPQRAQSVSFFRAYELGEKEGMDKEQRSIGNVTPGEYIRNLDKSMKEQGFLFDPSVNTYVSLV